MNLRLRSVHGLVFLALLGWLLQFWAPAASGSQTGTGSFFSTPAEAPVQNPFEVSVEPPPEALPPGGKGVVRVRFSIAPGFELYADQTSVTPEPVANLVFGAVIPPAATEKKGPDGEIHPVFTGRVRFDIPFRIAPTAGPGTVSVPLMIRYQGCSETSCFLPEEKRTAVALAILPGEASAFEGGGFDAETAEAAPAANPFERTAARYGWLGVLAAAFVWGLLTSLTPCIYPMIPVTVAVIGAGHSGGMFRGFLMSLLYVLGMSLTYAGFGVAAAWTGGLFGAYADHPAVRIGVAVIFVVLALGMFDIVHIRAPDWMSSRVGGFVGAGGIGVFMTGAAAGAVVGPCVGPMLMGLLVYIAALGDKLQGFLIMWSFALGMGVLFLVIGTFSGAAAALPRSGVWMVRLRHLFGVLMLGVALYYLRPLLPEAVFMLVLGALLIGSGIFAGAFDRIDTESGAADRLRKAAGILLLTLGIVYAARFAAGDRLMEPSKYDNRKPAAGIQWLHDEAVALSLAEARNQPLMIEFRADWCAACRKMEAETFRHSGVIEMAEAFIPLKIDFTETTDPVVESIREKYGVIGLPTLLFADASGRVMPELTITEFVTPEVLMARMHQVRSRL